MTEPEQAAAPPSSTCLLAVAGATGLLHAAQTENASLRMRADAMRAALESIARGVEAYPCFAAAKAINSDDALLAAYRIAKGLVR